MTRLMWDMPITIEVTDDTVDVKDLEDTYKYFEYIDEVFSVFKPESEISKLNNGVLQRNQVSSDLDEVLLLCEKTKNETNGYFDINFKGKLNPLGLVKGWAIYKAFLNLQNKGYENFYLEAGGDIQTSGKNALHQDWLIGIKNPFDPKRIVKRLTISNMGIATSGNYIRGLHIYNPRNFQEISNPVSLTVIAPNILDADRFATAAFAMGEDGINFLAKNTQYQAYSINKDGIATMTPGFNKFLAQND